MLGANLESEILGAVKVKDGLFIGDECAAQDLELVIANKITHVINCSGRQIANHWEQAGIEYLTYYWVDTDRQTILDPRDTVADETFCFIEKAMETADCILIHSMRGQSRSCCVLSAYLMKKYNWGLGKTLEFVKKKRPDLDMKPAFLQQLSNYEKRLLAQSRTSFTYDWNNADFSCLESEELLLRNTYINCQHGQMNGQRFHQSVPCNVDGGGGGGDDAVHTARKLMWTDNCTVSKSPLEKPASFGLQEVSKRRQSILKSALKKQGNALSRESGPASLTAGSDEIFLEVRLDDVGPPVNNQPLEDSGAAGTMLFQKVQACDSQRRTHNCEQGQQRCSARRMKSNKCHFYSPTKLPPNSERQSLSPVTMEKRRSGGFASTGVPTFRNGHAGSPPLRQGGTTTALKLGRTKTDALNENIQQRKVGRFPSPTHASCSRR